MTDLCPRDCRQHHPKSFIFPHLDYKSLVGIAQSNRRLRKFVLAYFEHSLTPNDPRFVNAVTLAVRHEDLLNLKLLLSNWPTGMCQFNLRGFSGVLGDAMVTAAVGGRLERLVAMLDAGVSMDITLSTPCGVCVVVELCARGLVDAVEILMQRGLNIHLYYVSCIAGACASGNERLVRTLLEGGRSHNRNLDTALSNATEQGHVEIMRLLLEHGANMNNVRFLPISKACEQGNVDLLRVLLQHGVSTTAALREAQHKVSMGNEAAMRVVSFLQELMEQQRQHA